MISRDVVTTPKWSSMFRNVAVCLAPSYVAEQSSTNVTWTGVGRLHRAYELAA